MNEFLNKYGWSVQHALPQDASTRSYYRARKGERTAILMHCMDENSAQSVIQNFVTISDWLRSIDLRAPEMFETEGAFCLIEDFGDRSFKSALESGHDAQGLYGLADQVLSHIQSQECPLDIPDFFDSRVYHGRDFLVEWFLPFAGVEDNPQSLLSEYSKAWEEIEKNLPAPRKTFLHIDYHLENLMFLDEGQGIQQCGILDFQDAMTGPCAYDLANLLEDARTDVPIHVRDEILSAKDEEFRAWYRVLATTFHCRLMGQFIKMAAEDGKDKYLQYLPRVSNYIADALDNPLLAPLKAYFIHLNLDFRDINRLNADAIAQYISKVN